MNAPTAMEVPVNFTDAAARKVRDLIDKKATPH